MKSLLTDPAPQAPYERFTRLDFLRGFAMAGVMLLNTIGHEAVGGDTRVTAVVNFFGDGTFYPLLAVLVGLGFAIQFRRSVARGLPGTAIWLRRSAALVCIGGVTVALFLGNGILIDYGVLAFPLLLFARSSSRTLKWAILVSCVLCVIVLPARHWYRSGGPGLPAVQTSVSKTAADTARERANEAWANGSYAEIVMTRAATVPADLISFHPVRFQTFALLLLGLWLAQRQTLAGSAIDRRLLRSVVKWGGIIGLVAAGANLINLRDFAGAESWRDHYAFWIGVRRLLLLVAGPALAFFYAALVLWLYEYSARWRERFRPLEAVGRMALTNFLLQWVSISGLFWLQRAGHLEFTPDSVAVVYSVVVFVLLARFSQWWLVRYRFGPAEWLWRTVTYWRAPRMRVEQVAQVHPHR